MLPIVRIRKSSSGCAVHFIRKMFIPISSDYKLYFRFKIDVDGLLIDQSIRFRLIAHSFDKMDVNRFWYFSDLKRFAIKSFPSSSVRDKIDSEIVIPSDTFVIYICRQKYLENLWNRSMFIRDIWLISAISVYDLEIQY